MAKQVQEVVIRITGDSKELQPTINKLIQMGQIDDKNAKSFVQNSKKQQAAIKETGTAMSGLHSQLLAAGSALTAAFSVQAIIEFGKEALHAFREAEKNANALRFAVTKIGGEGAAAFQKLIQQSEDLQRKSIFSDDNIQRAQTQLATFGLTTKQIEALTPKILDLASASGVDLATATDKVIQGINGQTRGLKEVGIAFEDTGSKTQNLNILTEKLAKFQGSAADALNTSAGAAQNLDNRFDDLMEKIGEFIDKGIRKMKEGLIDWVDLIEGNTDEISVRKLIGVMEERNKVILKKATEGGMKVAGQEAVLAFQRVEKLRQDIIHETKLREIADSEEELALRNKNLKLFAAAKKQEEDLIKLLNDAFTEKEKITEDLTLKGQQQKETADAKALEAARKAQDEEIKLRIEAIRAMNKADAEYDQFILDGIEKTKKEREKANQDEIDQMNKDNEELTKNVLEHDKIMRDLGKNDLELKIQQLKDERDAILKNQEFTNEERLKIEKEFQKKINDVQTQEIKERFSSFVSAVTEQMQLIHDERMRILDEDIRMNETAIEKQKERAEKGLSNTLAFEEKRRAELMRQRSLEERRLRRQKEIEAFLEAVISYNKEDPKSSILKALAQTGAIEGALAIFAEDGAKLGDPTNLRSRVGFGRMQRRHRSGRDIVVQAELGESVNSVRDTRAIESKWGSFRNFQKYLREPVNERKIPLEQAMAGSTQQAEVVQKIEALTEVIKKRPVSNVDADGLGNLVLTKTQEGMREVMKVYLAKPQIKKRLT